LPVDAALPALASALNQAGVAVLSAPPGSGKTTRVPLALLGADWLRGRTILMLEPRRLAARAAARFMARGLGQALGDDVGYRVRLDSRVSVRTRIEVVTEGILIRRLQNDPGLEGVGLVIFDEFHERGLDADLGLAFCLDVREALRNDLRLLIMSATLDVEGLRSLFGELPVVRAGGAVHPVEVLYAPGPAREPPARAALRGVLRALREGPGDVLAFLPGAAEIRRAEALLRERVEDEGIVVRPLYGDLPGPEQDLCLEPDAGGRRRVVLATAIAETSLTIEGVSRVVDTGWSRTPRFDPGSGLTRLVTQRVSRASADQRCGRAGRLGPGVCYRLWPEALTLAPRAAPEILQADLAPLVLETALWGVTDPGRLAWLDSPPAPAVEQALALLQRLEALDGKGQITVLGRRMAGLPLHPRLGHVLLRACNGEDRQRAADLVALLSERDVFHFRPGEVETRDLEPRLNALAAVRRGAAPPGAADAAACRRVARIGDELRRLVGQRTGGHSQSGLSTGALTALAYPDRLAQRRAGGAGAFRLANGRGVRIEAEDPLARADFLAIAAMDAGERNGRVFLASAIDRVEIESLFSERIRNEDRVEWSPQRQAVVARRETCLDALVLARRILPRPSEEQLLPVLLDGIRALGADCLPWTPRARLLQARVMCLRQWDPKGAWPDLADAALLSGLERWLAPWLPGIGSIEQLGKVDLAAVLEQNLDGPQRRRLAQLAPERIRVPSGAERPLRYVSGESPVLAVRLQEMFGQRDTPRVCDGRIPVTLHLLSPARRPLQITQDLAGFWDRTYAQVRKEMRGRYPKHYWPDDPRQAVATARVRPV
jgi:ATP-dependent helicase HrpB